jgi:hypothetical protein
MEKGTAPMYAIYVYEKPWTINSMGYFEYGTSEFVGFYHEKEVAIKAVEENWCDIQDHYANAAMIKEIVPGLYPHPPRSKCWYYIWNPYKECFEPSEIPDVDWWK